jgi:hypothetical protein
MRVNKYSMVEPHAQKTDVLTSSEATTFLENNLGFQILRRVPVDSR